MTTVPEPTVSQFDLEDQKERHRVAEREFQAKQAAAAEKAKTRRVRTKYTAYSFIALVAACAIVAFIYLMWQANKGPSAKDQLQQQEMSACIAKGGTWTFLGGGSESNKTCVFMKEIKP